MGLITTTLINKEGWIPEEHDDGPNTFPSHLNKLSLVRPTLRSLCTPFHCPPPYFILNYTVRTVWQLPPYRLVSGPDIDVLADLWFPERPGVHPGRGRAAEDRLPGTGSDGVRLQEVGVPLPALTCLPARPGRAVPTRPDADQAGAAADAQVS